MNNIKAYIEQHKDRFLNELLHLLRVPSISADPEYKQDVLKASEIIKSISHNSPTAITAAIKSINVGFDHRENGFEKEINEFGNCFGSEDFVEGTTAFMEKRKPNFWVHSKN